MNKSGGKEPKNLDRSLPRGRGREVEFRSKKQKNELHILKMSQEWDLRRQKRRLDRQKWVEERRNQKLPIWQRVGNLRVQVNEEILNEARNELVNTKQQIENSNESQQSRVTHEDKVTENSSELREKQIGSAFRVPTSRLSESTASGTSFSVDKNKDAEITFIKIEQTRTMEQPLLYNVNTLKTSKTPAQITEHCSIAPVKSSSKSTGIQLEKEHRESEKSLEREPETSRKNEVPCVTIKKLLRVERPRVDLSTNGEPVMKVDRKRKIDAISVDDDFREMPSLMRVDRPTTLETIDRESGPVTISSSMNDLVKMKPTGGRIDQTDSGKGEGMPQIKQCYSLLNRTEETPNVNFFAAEKPRSHSTPVSVSMASPGTMTTAPTETKGHVAMPPVSVDPKCIVYLSKPPASVTSPGAPSHPRPGYLVPVYKTNTRETAYAFLPASAQRPHRVGDKSSLEGRSLNHKTDCSDACCSTISHHAACSYPCPRSTTGLKEAHTGCVSSTGTFVPCSQPPHALHRDPIIQHSSHETINTAVTLNPSRTDSAYTNGSLKSGGSKNHAAKIHFVPPQSHKTTNDHSVEHLRKETTSTSSATPLAEDIRGAQTVPERVHYPAFNRTPDVAPSQSALNTQEAIFNPMSVYVRPKLVPREVVVVNHGTEPSPPLVEYIKTDAICDKELTKWDAKNVADFIAATDCADKAELFLEQEIDGKALLSLSPEMLMKGLNLKLGPSVKLYNHIANLRTALLL